MADIQETCQKNAASAVTVGRRDLLQVWFQEGAWMGEWWKSCHNCCLSWTAIEVVKPLMIGCGDGLAQNVQPLREHHNS